MLCILKILILIQIASHLVEGQAKLGDACNNGLGSCAAGTSNCQPVLNKVHNDNYEIPNCGDVDDSVCCPNRVVPTSIGSRISVDENSPVYIKQCNDFHKLIKNCDPPPPRIVNGIKADPREFPHMAWVGTKIDGVLKHYCGGTLISEKYVLTAANCIYVSDIPLNHVRLGELDYSVPSVGTQEFGIKKQIDHPAYDPFYSRYNDIALIELDRAATLNEYVMPACLPSSNGTELQSFVATGWGRTGNTNAASSHLLKVNLERFGDKECDDIFRNSDDPSRLFKGVHARTQICAGPKLDNRDTCEGHLGGPLFVPHSDYQCMFTVFGVTSFGLGCGTKGIPGVYTRVNLYVDWIEKVVWKVAGGL